MELEKTTASWVSILISPNAQSPTFSPHNPGKSGMPPSPEANASPFPASLHDYTQPTPTPTHQQRRRQQLNSLPTTMSKKDTQQWTASGFEKAQRDFSSSAVRRFRRFVCVCVSHCVARSYFLMFTPFGCRGSRESTVLLPTKTAVDIL